MISIITVLNMNRLPHKYEVNGNLLESPIYIFIDEYNLITIKTSEIFE